MKASITEAELGSGVGAGAEGHAGSMRMGALGAGVSSQAGTIIRRLPTAMDIVFFPGLAQLAC